LLPVPGSEVQLAWLSLFNGAAQGFEDGVRSFAHDAPEFAATRFDLARFLAARGQSEAAAAELESALAVSPSTAGFDRLARLHWQAGRSAETLALFARALALYPASPDLWFNQGVVLGLLGRVDEAAASFRRVLELAPDRSDARENLAGILEASGRGAEAR
ncbi:MAG: tetratricopeptide repeat protein, partial [Planctomycetes bacterium]|nr:tetratricopeptide repeat protein [Planctomycetota bacterium]